MFQPMCPVDVRVLPPEEAKKAVRSMLPNPTRLLVLASRGRCTALGLATFFGALQSDGHALQLYSDIPANPSVEDVSALLIRLREQPFEPTAILAIGGGSCIDLGKAASALYNLLAKPTVDAVREAIVSKVYAQPHACVPLIAMPTTAGTGSEVTRWATIWDATLTQKRSIDDAQGYPRAAIIVPEWTVDMPAALTLSTGLDALSHAMESFWAVSRNPVAQELALLSVRKVVDALPLVLAKPDDVQARRDMCLASLLAGFAFSQTRTTACHSISYPLTMLYGLPHGFAAAITLSSVMRRNRAAVPELERLMAVFADFGGFDAWLESVTRDIQRVTLGAFGITQADLPAIAQLTFTAGRMDNNPIVFTYEQVMEILLENR